MITASRNERVDSPEPVTRPTQLRPTQSAPVRRDSLPREAAHDGVEGITLSVNGIWYTPAGPPFAD